MSPYRQSGATAIPPGLDFDRGLPIRVVRSPSRATVHRHLSLLQIYDLLLVRQRRIFVLTFLAAFVAAAVMTFSLPKEYKATATLFVGENRPVATGANAVQLDDVLARTYASLLQTSDVERDVQRALPYRIDRGVLASKIDVEVVTGTRLIKISTLDEDSARAQQIANTYAKTFVSRRRASAAGAGRERLAELQDRIGRLSLEARQLESVTAPEAVGQRAQVQTELAAARDSYVATQQSIALQGTDVSVSSQATLPTSPAKPRPKLYLALGLAFALVLAGLAAALRNLFDQRVRDEEELSKLMGVPVIGRIPIDRGARGAEQSVIGEAFDILRANLQVRDGRELRVIAVTSALPSEGKSMTVTRLATAFARVGRQVVAVDCDLRRPMLATYMESRATRGVTNLLVEARRDPSELLVPSPNPGVEVLPSGPIPPSPAVLLGMPRLRQLFEELSEDHDIVIVDTPPVTVGADTTEVGSAVDGVILVVDLEQSRRRTLLAVREQLGNANVLGLVLNRTHDRDVVNYEYGAQGPEKGPVAGIGRRLKARA